MKSAFRILDSWPVRLLIVGALLLVVFRLAWPRYINHMSIDAIVQARRVPIVVPTEGMIDTVAVTDGREVRPGDLLFAVSDPRGLSPQATEYSALGERLRTVTARVEAIDARIAGLEKVREGLARRVRYHTQANVELQRARAAQSARNDATAASRSATVSDAAAQRALQASRELERMERLRSRNAATQSEVDEARAAAEAARANVVTSGASGSSGDAGAPVKTQAARRGILVGEGTQDVPVSQQEMDQIVREINQLLAERRASTGEADAIRGRMQQVHGAMQAASGAVFTSPVWGVVSSVAATQGMFVSRDVKAMELIDCSTLYVEATVPTRFYDNIRPGSRVRIQMVGREEPVPGVVDYIRGGSVKTLEDPAAELPARKKPEAHAFISFEPGALKPEPGSFCYVGRAATVLFDRDPKPAQTAGEILLRDQVKQLQQRLGQLEGAFSTPADTLPDYMKR